MLSLSFNPPSPLPPTPPSARARGGGPPCPLHSILPTRKHDFHKAERSPRRHVQLGRAWSGRSRGLDVVGSLSPPSKSRAWRGAALTVPSGSVQCIQKMGILSNAPRPVHPSPVPACCMAIRGPPPEPVRWARGIDCVARRNADYFRNFCKAPYSYPCTLRVPRRVRPTPPRPRTIG